jgi:vancomycin aglycone glucosyltransferase
LKGRPPGGDPGYQSSLNAEVPMRVLLTTIGSQGDVRPLVALASRLREYGHEAGLCVSPDFRDWIESLGFSATPIGPRMRGWLGAPATKPSGSAPQSPEQMRDWAEASLARQSATLTEAAWGCDVIVAAAGRPLVPARSVAETLGIGYVFVAFSPSHLPSPHNGPFGVPAAGQEQPASTPAGNLERWDRHARQLNDRLRVPLNRLRAASGLAPVEEVRDHIFTGRPWLAADPVLSPWPGADGEVFQAGAWILPDERPLDPALEAFLAAGDPPVYFGFGSMRMPDEVAEVVAEVTRRAGRRAIIAGGWAGLSLTAADPDLLVIGEVNQQVLFRRVAAVVHHGGAGTTTAAARAGAAQVIVPQAYDQPYWARRVAHLGIGTAHPEATFTADSLTAALNHALAPAVASRARALAPALHADGAQAAADGLIAAFGDAPADNRGGDIPGAA